MELSNKNIKFDFISYVNNIFINGDKEQINRAFFNLFKNSVESLNEKSPKTANFVPKIIIELRVKDNYICSTIEDNGIGFSKENIKNLVKPYFTTKKEGTGLGLAIVNKIINDHEGSIIFLPNKDGAKITINLPINVS